MIPDPLKNNLSEGSALLLIKSMVHVENISSNVNEVIRTV